MKGPLLKAGPLANAEPTLKVINDMTRRDKQLSVFVRNRETERLLHRQHEFNAVESHGL